MLSPSPSLPHSEGVRSSSAFFGASQSSTLGGTPQSRSRGGAPPRSVDFTERPRPEVRNRTHRDHHGGSGRSSSSSGSSTDDRRTNTSSALASGSPSVGPRYRRGRMAAGHAPTRNGVLDSFQDYSNRYPTAQSSFEYDAEESPAPPPHHGPVHQEESSEWEAETEHGEKMEGGGNVHGGAVPAPSDARRGPGADKVLWSLESAQVNLIRRLRPSAAGAQRTPTSSTSPSPTAAAAAATAAAAAAAPTRVATAVTRHPSDADPHVSISSSSARSSASGSALEQRDAPRPHATASTTNTTTTTTTTTSIALTASSGGGGGGAMHPPVSATRPVLDDPLAALSPAQVEAALQVYVNRGGVRASEVAAVLQTLPWCAAGPAHTTVAVTTHTRNGDLMSEEAEEEDERNGAVMIDPETWLSAVAAAVAGAAADGGAAVVLADAFPVPAAAAPTTTPRTAGSAPPASETPISGPGSPSDPSPPFTVDRTAKKRHSTDESDSSAVAGAVAAVTLAEVERCRASNTNKAAAGATNDGSTASMQATGQQQQQQQQHGVRTVPLHGTSTDRRLEYDDDDDNGEEEEGEASGVVASSYVFPQRPLLSSSLSSVQSPSGRPLHAHSKLETPQTPPTTPPVALASAGAATPATATVTAADTTAGAPATRPSSSLTPLSQPSAAVLAGMRLLFQRCLHTPVTSVPALLTDSDWYARVEQLREDGRRKLPPQPILDDVAHTIAQTMGAERHPHGISSNDFVRLLHRQLEEVRVDMTSPPPPPSPSAAAAAANRSGDAASAAGVLHFPSQPQYVLSLFGAPTASRGSSGGDGVNPAHGGLRRSRLAVTAGTGTGQWRVLPTWCMALAGLFPVEMAAVCPVPVVRYLRSVGLMHAVLDAILQRLQLEVEALPELAPLDRVERRRKSRKTKKGSSATHGTHGGAAAASAAARYSDPDSDAENYEWPPPQDGSSLRSRPVSGRARPPSSVVLMGSVVADEAAGSAAGPGKPADAASALAWQEQPSWNSGRQSGRPPTTVKPRSSGVADEMSPAGGTADASTKRRTTQLHHHLHDQRPLDEISASIVARAKARRLMDTLRRNTVPINRYECFARVEQEDEPVQKALCFVSKKELNATFGGRGGGDDDADGGNGDGVDDDSDAMSDMIAALTYNPANELAESQGANAEEGKRVAEKRLMDQTRTSVRPPQLPRMSASHVLPTVIMGTSRNGRARRSYASTSGAGSPQLLNDSSTNGSGAGRNGKAGSRARASLQPPPVSGMFRMSGVLSTALPRKQEAALVQRLSKPSCDPVAMGLRASSPGAMTDRGIGGGGGVPLGSTSSSTPRAAAAAAAGATDLVATPAAITAATAAAPMAIEDHPAARPAPMPAHHRRHMQLSTTHGTPGGSVGAARQQRSQSTVVWTNGFCAAVCANGRDLRAFRQPRIPVKKASSMTPMSQGYVDTIATTASSESAEISADTTDADVEAGLVTAAVVTAAPPLTVEQNRGFFFFNVPSVLVAAPLSSSAAAAAAAQVIHGGNSATGQLYSHPHQPPHQTRTVGAKLDAALTRQSRSTPYRQDGLRPSGSKRVQGVLASSAVPARTTPRNGTRSPSPQQQQQRAHSRPRATPDILEEMGRVVATIRQQHAHPHQGHRTPRSPTPPSDQHISLYERRLQRQLQLAYANEHAYHHVAE